MSDDKNNERILIEKAQAGDAAAFDQLVTEGFYRVYYVAFSWVGDEAAAEDITQETFVRALLSLDRLKNPDSFTSWLYAIARNLAKARHREKSKESRVLEKLISEYAIMDSTRSGNEKTPRWTAAQTEETLRLRVALAKIEPELREILLLHYAEELSQVEIARQLQLPAYTVCRRLESAYGQLRTLLNSDSLPNLGSLKPSGEAVNRMLMITAAIAGMSATAKAGLLNALGELGHESIAGGLGETVAQTADVLSNGYGVSINQPVLSGGGKSFMGKILGTAAGKLGVAAVCVGGLVFAGNNLAGRYDKSLGADKTLSAEKNDPESGRHNGAGKNRRGAGGSSNAAGTDSASRVRGSGSLTSSPALSKKDNTLTCPMVMISGKVTFEDGRPADSAGVELWQNGATYMGEQVSERLMARQPVGSDGSYRISAPDGTGIRLELKNAARAVADVKVADAPTSAPTVRTVKQDFVIPAMHTVKGKVVWDDSGEAVANAKVSLRTQADKSAGWYYDNEIRTTDEAGSFEIVNVATGKSDIGAIADGTAPAFQVINVPLPEGEEIVLRLKKATGSIAGELRLMPDETPVAGATIKVTDLRNQEKLRLRESRVFTTNDNGRFLIENVGDETLAIEANENTGEILYNAAGASLYWVVNGKNDTITPTTLNATVGYTVKGRVIDRDTGEGIEGVSVFNRKLSPPGVDRKTLTDKNGYYTLERIMYDNTWTSIFAEKTGWKIDEKDATLTYLDGITHFTRSATFNPLPEETNLDITMARTVLISGTLKNSFGLPISNATVEIKRENSFHPIAKTYSQQNGQFEIPITSFSNGYLLIQAKGYSAYSHRQLNVSNQPILLGDISLPEETIIRGKISTEDGSPILDDSLFIYLYPDDTEISGNSIITKGKYSYQTNTVDLDSLSQYEWRGAEPGNYVMIIQNQNYETTMSKRFTLNPGMVIDDINFFLKEKSNVKLSGSLTYEDGSNINDSKYIEIIAENPRYNVLLNLTDSKFNVTDLKKYHPYKLKYGLNNSDFHTTEVVFKQDDNVINLTIPNKVEKDYIFAVWDKETSEAIRGIKLKSPHEAIIGDGLEENEIICALESKDAKVSITGEGYPWQFVTVNPQKVETGEKINIYLIKGYKVSGRILDAETQSPVADVPINFWNQFDNSSYLGISTDSQGKFEALLPPESSEYGVYVKIQSSAPFAEKWIRLQILPDKALTNMGDIRLNKIASIALKLIDSKGNPLENVSVKYYLTPKTNLFEEGNSIYTDSRGMVSFNNLSTGNPNFHIVSAKYGSFRRKINLQPGENPLHTIQLGNVQSLFTLDRSLKPAEVIYIDIKNSEGHLVKLDFKKDIDPKAILTPGEWEATMWYSLSNKLQMKKIKTEKFSIPDIEVFEKQFIAP